MAFRSMRFAPARRPTERSLAAALAQNRRPLHPRDQEGVAFGRSDPAECRPGGAGARLCGVADALSVLCDRAYFGGSLDDLAAARRQFDGPILAKDFFIDLRQVAEARIAGADAMLVMLSLLDDEPLGR